MKLQKCGKQFSQIWVNFSRYFGRDNFILIDNNNATEKIFDKVYVEIGKLIDKKPSSRAAHAWMRSQRPG